MKNLRLSLINPKWLLLVVLFSSLGLKAQFLTPDFSYVVSCNTVIFTDLTTAPTPPTFWYWDFGDGSTSIDQNPIHVYADTGTYRVHLFVGNTTPGGVDSGFVFYDIFVEGCDDYNEITGDIYFDNDADGTYSSGAGDVLWEGRLVMATPGPYYGLSDASGAYSLLVPAGTYTVEAVEPTGIATTEPVSPYSVTFAGLMGLETDKDFGLTPTSPIQDLSAFTSTLWPPVPGFETKVGLFYSNEGNTFVSGSVTFTHDPGVTWVSSDPPADSYAGGVATWNFVNMMPASTEFILVTLDVPTTAIIGDTITHTAHIDPVSGDADPTNNDHTHSVEVLASYDPNDKLVEPAGVGEAGNIPLTTEWLTYTIRFQNTGTFMATNVVLVDTIDDDKLDLTTLEMMGASHPYELQIEDQGTLVWSFNGINLPDSTSDLAGSQGSITFRIKPSTIYPGLEINNFADIYFDFNAPIRTNTTRSTFAVASGLNVPFLATQLDLYPNPASDFVVVETGAFQGADFCLTSIEGRTLKCQQGNESVLKLDLSNLAAGTYLLHVSNENGYGEALIELTK